MKKTPILLLNETASFNNSEDTIGNQQNELDRELEEEKGQVFHLSDGVMENEEVEESEEEKISLNNS